MSEMSFGKALSQKFLKFFSFSEKNMKKELEALSDFIVSTAVEGCSYAEGAQRDSDAIPLRVPACGGVQFNNKLHHRPFEQNSRAATHKP